MNSNEVTTTTHNDAVASPELTWTVELGSSLSSTMTKWSLIFLSSLIFLESVDFVVVAVVIDVVGLFVVAIVTSFLSLPLWVEIADASDPGNEKGRSAYILSRPIRVTMCSNWSMSTGSSSFDHSVKVALFPARFTRSSNTSADWAAIPARTGKVTSRMFPSIPAVSKNLRASIRLALVYCPFEIVWSETNQKQKYWLSTAPVF